MQKIKNAGIEVTKIGEIVGQGTGVMASNHDKPVPWPRFEVDELTKLYN